MDLIRESFQRLFPGQEFNYQTKLEYNLRLSDFNSNIRWQSNRIFLHLNLQWKDIDDEIKIGLVQSLLLKVLKKKINSPNIELYHNFIRNIPLLTPKTRSDSSLEDSFQRVNEQFFSSLLEQPNLVWGQASFRKLASYNFHHDTITISQIFREAAPEILDYLMYHEALHKQQKYFHRNGRSFFHTRKFREAENLYPFKEKIEREIKEVLQNRHRQTKRLRGSSFWNFFKPVFR